MHKMNYELKINSIKNNYITAHKCTNSEKAQKTLLLDHRKTHTGEKCDFDF